MADRNDGYRETGYDGEDDVRLPQESGPPPGSRHSAEIEEANLAAQEEPTVLDEFRAFQRKWEENTRRATGPVEPPVETVPSEIRARIEALRLHWQGRTPPAQVPILAQGYQEQRERERRAIEQGRGYGRSY